MMPATPRTVRRSLQVALLLLACAGLALASPELHVPRAAKPPRIDGRLDDACWQAKPQITAFRCVTKGRPAPTQRTEGWVACDGDALYVAAKCFEAHMDMVAAYEKGVDAHVWKDDCLEIFLMPGTPYYYHFAANLIGARYDARIDSRPEVRGKPKRSAWDGDWRVAAHRAKDHWSMEFAIPFACLELGSARLAAPIKFNLGREQRRLTEFSCWPASGFHLFQEYATLKGLPLDTKRYGLRLRDVSMGEQAPGPNRFQGVIAEEPTPGARVTLRARVQPWPDGEARVFTAAAVSRSGAGVSLTYRVPMTGGMMGVTVEAQDPQGKSRQAWTKFFRVAAVVEAALDTPILYRSDEVARIMGRVAVPAALRKETRVTAELTANGKTLRRWPVKADLESGALRIDIPVRKLAPGLYAVAVHAHAPSLSPKPVVRRFAFRLLAGPFD